MDLNLGNDSSSRAAAARFTATRWAEQQHWNICLFLSLPVLHTPNLFFFLNFLPVASDVFEAFFHFLSAVITWFFNPLTFLLCF